MKKFVISNTAQKDLDNISEFTFEQWGDNQESIYIENLYKHFQLVTDNPKIGNTTDLPQEYLDLNAHKIVVGKHYICYRENPNTGYIEIMDIVHTSRHFQNTLQHRAEQEKHTTPKPQSKKETNMQKRNRLKAEGKNKSRGR